LEESFQLYFTRIEDCNIDPDLSPYKNMNLMLPSLAAVIPHLTQEDKILERASGWPTFDLKKTDPIAQRRALELARDGWKNGFAYVFSRFNKQKRRLFFPMPFCSVVAQAQYYYPFLEKIQEDIKLRGSSSSYTFWADKVGFKYNWDIATEKVESLDTRHLVYVQRDFEKMDTTEGPSQIRHSLVPKLAAAYHIKPGSEAYGKMEELMVFTADCGIYTPSGYVAGEHGTASGAEVTNGAETCSNEDFDRELQTILAHLCESRGLEYSLVVTFGNGDDGFTLYYLTDTSRLDEFKDAIRTAAEQAASKGGYRLQSDKWHISDEYGLYCQRMVAYDPETKRIEGRYPATLILNSIVNPEKEYTKAQWDKDYRDLDIIEKLDNGASLQYFHELVDYVDNGMKYRLLGKTENETRRILSKFERYRALQDSSETWNREQFDSLKDVSKSPTIEYLLSKRQR
jgi:hypothetical protein